MIEQEIASIIRFVLEACGNPTPYYHNIPESFVVPSVYFPVPEIDFQPDTFSGYRAEYSMFVNFFHSSTELAYQLAVPVCHSINTARRLIPEINYDGNRTGKFIRITNNQLKKADECAYQLQLDWISRYDYTPQNGELVRDFYMNGGKL